MNMTSLQTSLTRKITFSLFTLLLGAALLTITHTSAKAQTVQSLRASIPFDFEVSDRVLPAGTYFVRRTHSGGTETLRIQSQDGRTTIFAWAQFATGAARQESKLIFNCLGERHFLAEVSGFDTNDKHVLLPTQTEKRLAKAATTRQETIAVNLHRR
jgi:hypothetical protein